MLPDQPTVRDLVRHIQAELFKGDLDPLRARELLIQSTALLGNCLQEIREADAVYARVLLAHLDSTEAASRAKIRAETSPEYQRKQEARDTKELLQESARSLKYYLRSLSDEMQLAR